MRSLRRSRNVSGNPMRNKVHRLRRLSKTSKSLKRCKRPFVNVSLENAKPPSEICPTVILSWCVSATKSSSSKTTFAADHERALLSYRVELQEFTKKMLIDAADRGGVAMLARIAVLRGVESGQDQSRMRRGRARLR